MRSGHTIKVWPSRIWVIRTAQQFVSFTIRNRLLFFLFQSPHSLFGPPTEFLFPIWRTPISYLQSRDNTDMFWLLEPNNNSVYFLFIPPIPQDLRNATSLWRNFSQVALVHLYSTWYFKQTLAFKCTARGSVLVLESDTLQHFNSIAGNVAGKKKSEKGAKIYMDQHVHPTKC